MSEQLENRTTTGGTPRPPGAPRAGRRYPEISASSIIFGIVLGALMNAAITYAGLKIGFTIVGSAVAAVLGFGVLRGLLRRGTILEVNMAQTIASTVNTANAGIIFTVPVLMLLGHNLEFRDANFWWITLAATAGAVLGCVFIVPLRKQMIDIDRLRFPSSTAVAAILKSPGAGPAKSVVLVIGAIVAMLIYLPAGLPQITSPAPVDQLDALVARERITAEQAARTRQIAGWIGNRAAPVELVERGRLLEEQRAARERADAGDASAATQVAALGERIDAIQLDGDYNNALAVAAYEASQGRREWNDLRSTEFGWAPKPMWGYQDLGWRMREQRDAGTGRLTPRVDRDANDRPDLLVQDDRVDVGRMLGFVPDEMQIVFAIAPFALGAGYLTGRAGLMVLAGGLLAYLVLNPLAYNLHWMPMTVTDFQAPAYALQAFNRPLGIGLLLGGALMGVAVSLPAIKEAIKSVARASTSRGGSDEMSLSSLAVLALVCVAIIIAATKYIASPEAGQGGWLEGWNPWAARAVIAVVACVWIWFAGIIIAQCTGMTDWSPISGMALLTVVLVMMLSGKQDVVSAVMLGCALCVAIACSSDMMGDLKTGHLIGATPRQQQWWQIATAVIGPVIAMATLMLIAQVNMKQVGLPIGPGTTTVAPQAQALEVIVNGVRGGDMPYALYGLGALAGVLLGLGAFPGLGVLVGLSMYLPVFYILTYGIGCIVNIIVGRIKGRDWAEEWGVPFCAGLVVGEASLALVINGIVLLKG